MTPKKSKPIKKAGKLQGSKLTRQLTTKSLARESLTRPGIHQN